MPQTILGFMQSLRVASQGQGEDGPCTVHVRRRPQAQPQLQLLRTQRVQVLPERVLTAPRPNEHLLRSPVLRPQAASCLLAEPLELSARPSRSLPASGSRSASTRQGLLPSGSGSTLSTFSSGTLAPWVSQSPLSLAALSEGPADLEWGAAESLAWAPESGRGQALGAGPGPAAAPLRSASSLCGCLPCFGDDAASPR